MNLIKYFLSVGIILLNLSGSQLYAQRLSNTYLENAKNCRKLNTFVLNSQVKSNIYYPPQITNIPEKGEKVYDIVSERASFPEGVPSLFKWLYDNMNYPQSAIDNEIKERVEVTFIVEKDGTITNPYITKSINKEIDAEALKLVNKMPKWEPGRRYGEIVRSYFTLPISFKYHRKTL